MSERAAGPRTGQRCHGMRSVGVGQRAEVGAAGPRAGQRCHSMRRVGAGQHSDGARPCAVPQRPAGPRAGQRCHSSRSVGGGQHSDGARPCAMSLRCKRMARGQPAPHQALPGPGCPLRRLALQRASERKPRSRDTKSHSARRHCLFLRVVPAACGFQYLVSAFQGVIHGFLLQHVQENFSIGEC